MSEESLKGKVQTVLGPIDGGEMGVTLPHEHVFIDLGVWFIEPTDGRRKHLSRELLRRDHPDIGYFRFNPYFNRDNLVQLDEREAVEELLRFKIAGGQTVVCCSSDNLARDPIGLQRVSRATGLNIIMGSGYYVGASQDAGFDAKTEDQLTEEMIRDVTVGTGPNRVRAGLIGELGCSWPLEEREKKTLRAAAAAQQATGASINIHPGRHEESPIQTLKIIAEAGGDTSRVIMSHMDRTPFSLARRLEMAETGCVLEYDCFGQEGYYPLELAVAHMPNDVTRIKEIIELRDRGFLNQVFASHDICYKIRRYTYGGHGFAHLLENVVPVMRAWGLSQEDIETIMIANPRRMFSLV